MTYNRILDMPSTNPVIKVDTKIESAPLEFTSCHRNGIKMHYFQVKKYTMGAEKQKPY